MEIVLCRPGAETVLALLAEASWVGAPELYCSEIANALWKHVRAGDFSAEDAHGFLRSALDLVDEFVPARELVSEAMTAAIAHAHPVYDAMYAITAVRHGATVCTFDKRLKKLLEAMLIPSL